MYEIEVIEELDSGHILDLPYDSKCKNIHGHRWLVKVKINAPELNNCGMIIDFTHVKAVLKEYDHKFFICSSHELMDLEDGWLRMPGHFDTFGIIPLPAQPTAEFLAELLFEAVAVLISGGEVPVADRARVVSVELWETESGRVIYKP